MLKEIINNYKKQWFKVTIGWFITSIFVVTFIAFTIVMVEYTIPNKDINAIIYLGISYFILNIIRSIGHFFEDLNDEAFEKEIEADYREKIYVKLQNVKQGEIDKVRVGEVLENIINDTKEFSKWYGTGICRAYFGGIVRLIGTLIILMYLNVPIVIIALIIYLLGFILTHIFNKKSIKYTKIRREINAKILNWSNEQVQGYSTIKALEIENERLIQIKTLISEYEKVVNKLEKNIRIYKCIYDFIISFIGVMNILIGSIGVEEGIITYGAMIIIARYISSPETYAKWVIDGFQIRNIGRISYDRINSILQKEEENIDIGEELNSIENISVNNINFGYDNGKNVLTDISFQAKKNQRIALVGRSGSGKTTLVNLICRFYELSDGKMEINGKDYR